MIRNQWYVILESSEVKKGLKKVRRLGEDLVLWRDEAGSAHCLLDRCCHRGAALSKGKIVDGQMQCPFHGLEYGGDGRCGCIPANSRAAAVPERFRVPSYPVYEKHGWIWIWWGQGETAPAELNRAGDTVSGLTINSPVAPPAGEPEYFTDLDDDFAFATVQDPWKTHYSRVLENQLDVVHLPFVHHNTIGRGNRTVVDGPGVEWIGDRMLYTYVFNRTDDGTLPKKPDEVPVPPADSDFKLEVIMPNLWENRIAEKFRIVAAFVPVDGENTILYLRVYQKFMKIPVLKQLVHWLSCRSNLYVAHQDRRVVETQVPKRSYLRGGEQLIQGDLPIMEYRKKRESYLSQLP